MTNNQSVTEKKIYVRDIDGARMTGLSINTFRKLAERFGAVYFVGRSRLTDIEAFKKGMKTYKAR